MTRVKLVRTGTCTLVHESQGPKRRDRPAAHQTLTLQARLIACAAVTSSRAQCDCYRPKCPARISIEYEPAKSGSGFAPSTNPAGTVPYLISRNTRDARVAVSVAARNHVGLGGAPPRLLVL